MQRASVKMTILLEIENADLHAKDILYHPSCYKNYTSPRYLELLIKKEIEEEEEKERNANGPSPHEQAFLRLAKEVEEKVLCDTSSVTSLSDLCSSYRAYLQEEGVEVEIYRADKLKVRLVKHFGSQLCFHRPQKRNESQYVFSSAVPAGPLVERCLQLEAAAEQPSSDEDISIDDIVDEAVTREDASEASHLFAAAMILRRELLSLKNQIPIPPDPSNISENELNLPVCLYNFLCWTICGDQSCENLGLSEKVKGVSTAIRRRILSIGQDLVYCTSRGKVKTPKHVALPLALKHITGSTRAVTILNRFGHGISESQLSEYESAMAYRQIQQQEAHMATVPSNIKSFGFTVFCWDNNDIHEETPSGAGTTRCTNGIVVQRQVSTASPYLPAQLSWPNRHRRSVDPPLEAEVEYNAGRRQGPLPIDLPEEAMVLPQDDPSQSAVTDFTWILSRLLETDSLKLGQVGNEQQISGWAGFNTLLRRDDEILPSVVGYLPIIPTSPTQLSTVYLLLQRSIAVADRLQQTSVVIVLDQAIYSKAQEIIWKHRAEFSRVVLQMGGFHTSLAFVLYALTRS